MPKFKRREGCVKCGRTDRHMLGVTAIDKQGEKIIVGICFSCIAKQAEEKIITGYSHAEKMGEGIQSCEDSL